VAIQKQIPRLLHPASHEAVNIPASSLCGVAQLCSHSLLVRLEPGRQLGRLVASLENPVGFDGGESPQRRSEDDFGGS
jgi:hypothetical protein